jgi:hypothetical protein
MQPHTSPWQQKTSLVSAALSTTALATALAISATVLAIMFAAAPALLCRMLQRVQQHSFPLRLSPQRLSLPHLQRHSPNFVLHSLAL